MTSLTWLARLREPDGLPAAKVALQLQIFDMVQRGWIPLGDGLTADNGAAKGEVTLPDGTDFAPALRLVEAGASPALLIATPSLTPGARDRPLTVDFGEITRTHPPKPVSPVPLAPPSARVDAALNIGSVRPSASDQATVLANRVNSLNDDVTRLSAERDALALRIGALTAQAERAKALEADLSALIVERDGLRSQVAAAAELNLKVNDLTTELAHTRGENLRLREDLRVALDSGATAAAVEVPPVRVSDFATQVGEELKAAQSALESRGLALGGFTLTTRAEMRDGGRSLKLPTATDLKTIPSGMLSDLVLDFREPSPSGSDASGVATPDVRRLTESAAARVLASVGLKLETVWGPRNLSPDAVPGQAMLQSPPPGTKAQRGTSVLVTFAQSLPEPTP